MNSGGQMADEPTLSQCSQQAWSRAHQEQMGKGGIPAQVVQRDKSGRPVVTSDSVSLTQSDVQEQTYFNLCMKEKGYDLVPIKPGAGR
jgi:hypothetical protein